MLDKVIFFLLPLVEGEKNKGCGGSHPSGSLEIQESTKDIQTSRIKAGDDWDAPFRKEGRETKGTREMHPFEFPYSRAWNRKIRTQLPIMRSTITLDTVPRRSYVSETVGSETQAKAFPWDASYLSHFLIRRIQVPSFLRPSRIILSFSVESIRDIWMWIRREKHPSGPREGSRRWGRVHRGTNRRIERSGSNPPAAA